MGLLPEEQSWLGVHGDFIMCCALSFSIIAAGVCDLARYATRERISVHIYCWASIDTHNNTDTATSANCRDIASVSEAVSSSTRFLESSANYCRLMLQGGGVVTTTPLGSGITPL